MKVLVLPFRKPVSSRILYWLRNNGKAKTSKKGVPYREMLPFFFFFLSFLLSPTRQPPPPSHGFPFVRFSVVRRALALVFGHTWIQFLALQE